MEQTVVTHQEDTRKLLVVIGHHRRLRGFLRKRQKVVHVLDTAEGFLPQFEFHGTIQLREARVEVTLQCISIREVNSIRVVRGSRHTLQVLAKHFTQAAEFSLPLVLQTEVQCLISNLLVRHLQACVVLQNIKRRAVCFPQELEPWRHERAIRAVTLLILRHTAEQDAFWRLTLLEVIHIQFFVRCVSTTSCLGNLGICVLQKVTRYIPDRLWIRVLECIFVLHKCIFRCTTSALVHTQLHEPLHQWL